MTLYVLTSGEYSSYHINGIFSTLEKAEYAKRLLCACDIEEWELDELPDHPPGLLHFWVRMDMDGNNLCYGQDANFSAPDWEPGRYRKYIAFHMWAKDQQHAIKIANERRIALLASCQLTDDWKVFEARKILK